MAASNLNNRIQKKAEKRPELSCTKGLSVPLSTSVEACPEQVLWNSFPGPSIPLGRQALIFFPQDFCINGIYISLLKLQLWTSIASWDYCSLKKQSSGNKHRSESKLEPQPQQPILVPIRGHITIYILSPASQNYKVLFHERYCSSPHVLTVQIKHL